MRKHGVVFKLFVVTSVLILIVFSLVMLAESLFFERFYRATKIDKLERNMGQFGHQYAGMESNEIEAARLLGNFMNHNNASIAILNKQFERMSLDPYFIRLQAESKTITIRIPSDGTMTKDIPIGLRTGDMLAVDGIFMDEEDAIMQPVKIHQQDSELGEGLVRVKGKITDLLLPEQRSFNPFYQDNLIDDALLNWKLTAEKYKPSLQDGSPVQVEWSDKWSGVKYAVVILALSEVKGGDRYVFAMTSLQPVGEAVGILQKYYIYLAPVILILVIVLSLIFSRIVSKPLVKLNRSAARMAQLDFTVQPEINSKDEFGELSRSMNTLSHKLDTTLKELTHANVKLQEDMEEKQRLEQLRKELIANISHELKTPLGIIKGFTEGIQDDVARDKRKRYLTLILNEVDRMNALIIDMLELSKFEAKAVRIHPKDISLGNFVQKVVASFTYQLESKHLNVRMTEDNGLMVCADPRRMEQVIINILSNAIRHAVEHSMIRIEIQRTSFNKVVTRIENDGPPISEEDLGRIWEQFYRAERSRDRKFGGTGLGLAIVKHILELHGSEYGVENTILGVAFYFTLEESRGENIEQ